jgi:predicted RNase H-like HicB family nuclease
VNAPRIGRRREVELYRLRFVLREPSEDTEERYLAEIPTLPGCRAWGETAAHALEVLQSVTTAFIESYKDRGDALPPEVEAAAQEVNAGDGLGEVLVAV